MIVMPTSDVAIMGPYPESLPTGDESLTLRFSPSRTPIQQRWRNNGLSADFLADYLMTFLLNIELEKDEELFASLKSSTAYVANELLENAMKFNDESSNLPIIINLNLYPDKVVFFVSNSIREEHIIPFQSYIAELISSDPEELYFSKLENEDELPLGSGAGLGILTMINQHQALIGWKFTSRENENNACMTTVTTSVTLPINIDNVLLKSL